MSTAEREDGGEAGQEDVRQIYDPVGDTPPRYRRDPEEAHPPLDYPPYIYATSKKLNGFAVNPGGAYRLENVWLA